VFIKTPQSDFKLYTGLCYILFGLKTSFDVYRSVTDTSTYRCITQFGEEIVVRLNNGRWIDVGVQQETSVSKAIGKAIEQ
jgi:hypothetical protein